MRIGGESSKMQRMLIGGLFVPVFVPAGSGWSGATCAILLLQVFSRFLSTWLSPLSLGWFGAHFILDGSTVLRLPLAGIDSLCKSWSSRLAPARKGKGGMWGARVRLDEAACKNWQPGDG